MFKCSVCGSTNILLYAIHANVVYNNETKQIVEMVDSGDLQLDKCLCCGNDAFELFEDC